MLDLKGSWEEDLSRLIVEGERLPHTATNIESLVLRHDWRIERGYSCFSLYWQVLSLEPFLLETEVQPDILCPSMIDLKEVSLIFPVENKNTIFWRVIFINNRTVKSLPKIRVLKNQMQSSILWLINQDKSCIIFRPFSVLLSTFAYFSG